MPNDNARINHLRLELSRAAAIFSSKENHALLERQLGEIWDRALALYAGDNTLAATYLLSPNPTLEGKRPFDVAISGQAGYAVVQDCIGRIEHGIFA